MLLLFVSLALAAPDGHLVLDTTPGATIKVFPRMDPGSIELTVYNNSKPLAAQLQDQSPAPMIDSWASSIGSGTWFVTLYVDDPNLTVSPTWKTGLGWVLTFAPQAEHVSPTPALRTVPELLSGDVDRRPARPKPSALHPLEGDAWTLGVNPSDMRLAPEPWNPTVRGPHAALLRTTPSSRARVAALRRVLVKTDDPWIRTVTLYRLGEALRGLGLHRDARYYFDEVSRQVTDWPRDLVHMNRADAYLASGRWDEARQRCDDAHEAGADDSVVLECLAAVSLATSDPPPTQTARALLNASNRSQAHLLAAQLLVKDGRHPEAKKVLQNIRRMAPDLQRYRDATLGDVLYYEGDYDGAYQSWRDVGIGGALGDLTVHRQRMVRLAQRPPSTWAEELPAFVRDAARHRYGAEESHYLAAQIGETYDDPDITARHLTGLTDRFPTVAAASDVPQRLLRLCTNRLLALYNAGRYADQVGFYRDCWRDELDDVVISVEAQRVTADAFGKLGLWNDALDIQRRVANILIRNDREVPAALESLATLYARTGRTAEALETVQYARAKGLVADRGWAFDLVEADALAASGDVSGALVAWRRAERHPLGRAEATVRRAIALAEAGRCREALPVLERIANERQQLIDANVQPEDAQLAVGRCLLDDDKFQDAVTLANALGAQTSVAHYRSQAAWIAAVATTRLGGTPDLPDDLEPDPFWRRRLDEAKADTDLDRRVDKAL